MTKFKQREIKFRVYDFDKGMWIFWEYDYKTNEFIKTGLTNPSSNLSKPTQFTGRHDKNKKEIYEGNIIKDNSDNHLLIQWNNKFASFGLDKDGWMFTHFFEESIKPEECEVIGNIFENPELMGAKK